MIILYPKFENKICYIWKNSYRLVIYYVSGYIYTIKKTFIITRSVNSSEHYIGLDCMDSIVVIV